MNERCEATMTWGGAFYQSIVRCKLSKGHTGRHVEAGTHPGETYGLTWDDEGGIPEVRLPYAPASTDCFTMRLQFIQEREES